MPKQQTDASRGQTKPLTQGQINDLCSILVKRKVLVELDARPDNSFLLKAEDRDRVINAIRDEFIEVGLGPDSEPNKRGLELEDLLARVNNVHALPEVAREDTEKVTCSFCGKDHAKAVRIIGGARGFICDECVGLCVMILGSELPEWLEQHKKFIAETDWAELRKLPKRNRNGEALPGED